MDLADDSDQAATPDLEQALILAGVVGMIDPPRVQAALAIADDNSATIVQAVREGRSIFDNIRNFLRCWLSSNMGEVLTVFLGMIGASVIGFGSGDLTGGNANAHAVVLPLLATQLLWINLVTDLGPALALGKDPPVGDLMARPPRHQTERLTDGRMWRDVFAVGLVTAALTLITMDIQLPGGLIEDSQSLTTARTAGFTVPVLASLFNCVCARSDTAKCLQTFLRQPLVVGCHRAVSTVASDSGSLAMVGRRLRHRVAELATLGHLRGEGQRGAVVQ